MSYVYNPKRRVFTFTALGHQEDFLLRTSLHLGVIEFPPHIRIMILNVRVVMTGFSVAVVDTNRMQVVGIIR